MKFNNVFNNLLSTLLESNKTTQTIIIDNKLPDDYRDIYTTPLHKRTDRLAVAISVSPPWQKDGDIYLTAAPVQFEIENGKPTSWWWDANHDVLYQGSSASEAQRVFKETLLQLPHKVWKTVGEASINDINIETEKILQKFAVFGGDVWKVVIDNIGDNILTIGVELDLAPYFPERQSQEDLYGF